MNKYYELDDEILNQCCEFLIADYEPKRVNMCVFDYCNTFLSDRSIITIERVTGNDTLFEGTVKELNNTLDADLRLTCSIAPVKKAIPALCLRKGTPLSTCLMI